MAGLLAWGLGSLAHSSASSLRVMRWDVLGLPHSAELDGNQSLQVRACRTWEEDEHAVAAFGGVFYGQARLVCKEAFLLSGSDFRPVVAAARFFVADFTEICETILSGALGVCFPCVGLQRSPLLRRIVLQKKSRGGLYGAVHGVQALLGNLCSSPLPLCRRS